MRTHRVSEDIPTISYLWILRVLIPLGGHQEFIRKLNYSNEGIAKALGFISNKLIDLSESQPKVILAELHKLHQLAERKWCQAKVPSCLGGNIVRLSKLLGLSEADRRILEFAVMVKNERLLYDATEMLGDLSPLQLYHVLSVLLDLPEQEIRNSLSTRSTLMKSGLIAIGSKGIASLSYKLGVLSDSFADALYSSEADPVMLLRDVVNRSTPAELKFSDYEHIGASLAILRPYLEYALRTKKNGVNIFVYGPPGTGKSQLAKVIAKELDCELFEIASADEEGYAIDGEQRLRAFRAAQCFFAKRKTLMLFDEIEDVFNDGNGIFGYKSTGQIRKGWINRMLEENPVPTLWLSNSKELDPAFIRRFDLVLEIPIPPKKKREQIIQVSGSDLLDTVSVARFAESEELAPAVVSRAVSVIRSIHEDLGAVDVNTAIELLINNTLKAQGYCSIRSDESRKVPEIYDPKFIHADTDLTKVAAGLVQAKSGRLCLYGPPGTGKTAFGHWLAEQMGCPLLVKSASELISKWVGESEKNIARLFRQAEQEGALLIIDEIDSFLLDRAHAQHSWEISIVNEMLTHMESFPGIFVASTNFIKGIDLAALRRFDLKVKFDFMKTEQAWALFCRYCKELFLTEPDSQQKEKLLRLQKLTLGDFATVMRQKYFRSINSPDELIAALEVECRVKGNGRSSIGFH
ncbi:AAA family ATPase [Nitrosomonas nitrosa]|uniref:AAA family ATPase n=1 Tax=Nitrosomonas nitrosa TaxID=52442 RepID=A0A8H8Z468_9PROT|nr:ATP-binding protein [Nitrosomonas nitrosa]CAE6516642.1 AAA family ATPase [Nitrosomonas nitrosa]